MHTITIDNADKLRTIIEFARENKCADQLGKDLLNFLMILTCGMVERDADGKIQPTKHDEHAKVYADFAPYSLCFALYRNEDDYVIHCDVGGLNGTGEFVHYRILITKDELQRITADVKEDVRPKPEIPESCLPKTADDWISQLVGLSDDPLRRAAQIALAAIDSHLSEDFDDGKLEAAYETLQTVLN